MKRFLFTVGLIFCVFFVLSWKINPYLNPTEIEEVSSYTWADSLLEHLTLDEKIAQLIIVRAHSNKKEDYEKELISQIKQYQVGGVCFFQGNPVRQAILTNQIQEISNIPAFVSIDGEWGLAMRLNNVIPFPRQMALGAGYDTVGIYQMGEQIAKQCKRMGIHFNFAPCVDVNNNAKNPVINSRSFGEDPVLVTNCGKAYMKGMQDNGVLASIKHFPGHGDTESDSHFALPKINHDLSHLGKIELFPFKKLIDQGAECVMVSHLNVPALDSTPNSIASTSKKIITDFLKNSLGFKGLIVTDGLEMKGITESYPVPGDLEVAALAAGNDILLLPPHSPQVVLEKVKEALISGVLTEEEINEKCLKVLKFKEKYVLGKTDKIPVENLLEEINSKEALHVCTRLTQKSITLLKNDRQVIPLLFNNFSSSKLIHFRIDNNKGKTLETALANHLPLQTIRLNNSALKGNTTNLIQQTHKDDYVLVSLHNMLQYPSKNYGVTDELLKFLKALSQKNKVILVLMGNPYVLNHIPFVEDFSAVLVAYHPVEIAEQAVADALCNKIPIQGKLPVTLTDFACQSGIQVNVQSQYFNKVDSIVLDAIKQNAFPGCQILIAQKDSVLYKKNFGTHIYDNSCPVTENDLYDVASITKVMATTLAVMKLYEEGKIKLTDKLSKFLPYLKNTNKENITISEVMTHTAGLKSWIPFYKQTLLQENNQFVWNPDIYNNYQTETYTTQICKDMYVKTSYRDSVLLFFASSPLKNNKNYEYSDIGFYLLADLVYKITQTPLDKYVETHFYAPMGLTHTLFNPTQRFSLMQITPTENDTFFRKQLVHGFVHDQGAAILGGVSGHAGLFSTTNDLFALSQMLLNKGTYQNVQYLKPQTVEMFTSYIYPHICRRGFGFDKPNPGKGRSPCSKFASKQSYGHSGFTGTFFWIDPQYDLIYIFLSNRVYPSADNQLINKLNVREGIQDIIYKMVRENEN